MPNVNGSLSETVQQIDLKADGLRFSSPIPGFGIPSIVGPFNYFDLRARLTQTVADLTALNNYRSAKETLHANEFFAQDSKDLVVLAVGGAYLQVIAARARVESAKAQLETANALYQQTAQQRSVGLLAQIDVNKSQVQMLTQKQRLASLAERSREAENQSGPADRPAAERSLRTVRRCAFRRSARRRRGGCRRRRH